MNNSKLSVISRLIGVGVLSLPLITASAHTQSSHVREGVSFQSLVDNDVNLPAVKIYSAEEDVKSGHFNRAVINYMDAIKDGQTQAAFNIAKLIKSGKVSGTVLSNSLNDLSTLAVSDKNISYFLGVYYKEIADVQDRNLSFKWLNNALSLGCIDAAPIIAEYVSSGLKVANQMYSHENAASMLKLSADSGSISSAYSLAEMIYNDKLVSKNMKAARHYYSIAADENYKGSLYMVAYMTEFGLGCKKDVKKAVDMYKIVLTNPTCSDKTRGDAGDRLASILMYGKDGIPKNRLNGITFLVQSADFGQVGANAKLGLLYLYGDRDFKINVDAAIKRLVFASSKGSEVATNTLYQIYKNGLYGVPEDSKMASKYKLKLLNI